MPGACGQLESYRGKVSMMSLLLLKRSVLDLFKKCVNSQEQE